MALRDPERMPRPNHSAERRQQFLPIIARAFAEFGYRRTTTAVLAKRCEVRENVLYRLWPDKKAMFVAAIEQVFESSSEIWRKLLQDDGVADSPAERLLAYEAAHHGEFGLYRIVFAGLSETDDPEISAALKRMYGRFQRFLRQQITAHRGNSDESLRADATLAAWAVVGLGTVANISRELGLLPDRQRRRLLADVGRLLLEGRYEQD